MGGIANTMACLKGLLTLVVGFGFLWGEAAEGGGGWTIGNPMNTPRALFAAAVDACGNIYAIGGVTTWQPAVAVTETVEKFDGEGWSFVAPLPHPRAHHGAVAIGDLVYVIGGQVGPVDKATISSSCLRYDQATDTWSSLARLNIARMDAGVVADTHGRIYIIGGWDGAVELGSVEMYDLARPQEGWTLLPQTLQTPRSYVWSAIDMHGRIYAIGGSNQTDHLISVERFDPCNTGAGWTYVHDLLTDGIGRGAVTGADGRIYVVGSWDPGFSPRVDRYDPNNDAWEEWAQLNEAKQTVSPVLLPDGRIFAVGGVTFGGPNAVTTVEILTPPCGAAQARPLLMDSDGDGTVSTSDLLELLDNWGLCP